METPHQSPISPGRSWYEEGVARPRFPALDGDARADVAIVGGGYTGLSAALHLARAGASVLLIEGARLGDGASGRNGGQMNTGQRLGVVEMEEAYGFERAKALFDLAEDAKAHLLDLMASENIDADYRLGQLSVVHKKRYLADYRAEAEKLALRYGYPHVNVMAREETAARLGSNRYFGGLRDTGTGHIHPMKLLVGLARAAHASGARIVEDTKVTRVRREGGGVVVETARGTVRAERALLAANAYGTKLSNKTAAHIMPIGSFIGATQPLPAGTDVLPGGEAVDDSRFVVRYFRKSRDNRLLFGGREAYTSATGDIGAHIKRQIAEIYPQLKDVPLTHAWGGYVGITPQRMPYVREVEPGITAIGGYSGHGVMLSNFSGRLYAERVSGNRDRLRLLEELKISAFPGGGALRAPILFLALTWFALRDRF
ncbi:NAD(P)/FAD-dependent oxidoreductase [Antarcticirhabdus aurantiaca]|uniref:FAD-binding oxidoreductase n=1 Tax=Antarcticirhabdus aurantiaca TaxID=2606717 RepID=A0ACD4NPR6_9HYPH|nr:FAD-binding oxidoreductase [Antarcticirhabdus aurantiaca]WAJ28838.1 FAD-binding oxidoreductase [Jeongeuplla avenae]